jgi:hypothetical protein
VTAGRTLPDSGKIGGVTQQSGDGPGAGGRTAPGSTGTGAAGSPGESSPLPPDPAAYDDPRAVRARARGLPGPYIAGGEAPDPAAARSEERRLSRILVIFVVATVLSGFVLGAIATLFQAVTGS